MCFVNGMFDLLGCLMFCWLMMCVYGVSRYYVIRVTRLLLLCVWLCMYVRVFVLLMMCLMCGCVYVL